MTSTDCSTPTQRDIIKAHRRRQPLSVDTVTIMATPVQQTTARPDPAFQQGHKPIECFTCGRVFGQMINYNRHVMTHSTSGRYKCKYGCTEMFFGTHKVMMEHTRKVHNTTLGTSPSTPQSQKTRRHSRLTQRLMAVQHVPNVVDLHEHDNHALPLLSSSTSGDENSDFYEVSIIK